MWFCPAVALDAFYAAPQDQSRVLRCTHMTKRRRLLLLGILGAGAIGTAIWIGLPRVIGPRVAVARATRSPLVQSIVTTGRVRPPARATLASLVAGKVTKIGADEGDRVSPGQILAQFDQAEALAAVSAAEARVAETEAQGRQVRTISNKEAAEAVRRARARVDEAKRAYSRIQSLFAEGYADRETMEEAGTALSLTESELRAAQIQQRDVSGTRADRIEASRRQAEAELASARARLAHHQIVSPFDGTVVERQIELGDVAGAGVATFVVVRSGATELVVEPDERNLALLAMDQPATASAEAFPDQSFAARINYIAPAVDARRGTIEVRLAVPDAPTYLRPDMTVSVEIEVGRRDETLVVPADTVRDLSSPSPWVLSAEGGRATRRDVSVGIVGDDLVEVLSGVEVGTPLIPNGANIAPDQPVRPEPDAS